MQEVTLTQSIGIATTEVTQAQWISVMRRLPRNFNKNSHATGDNFPIHSLTWSEATDFCKKLSEIDTPNIYRLPTEAEWEIACRAGNNSPYSNNRDTLRITEANFFDTNSDQTLDAATTVASYAPNAWGLYDMHGNLWEWTGDWSGEYSKIQTVNPASPNNDSETDINLRTRILRGGSYYDEVEAARSGNRWQYAPSIATDYIGFRIVKEHTL
ncbi:MAG: sulfatase activating formylglycine-generating enzyme [Lentimonas sp.]